MLRSAQILSVVASLFILSGSPSELRAQGAGAAKVGQLPAQISPELARLLTNWSQASDRIKTLHGRHTRRVYDNNFFVEKISYGEVWFEAPDKGRIDIKAVEITEKMLADRQKPDAKVQRDANNVPYKLISDDEAKWICDGERVFDINEKKKEAQVASLPPTLRGENIMDSPLPFLFGMPPQQAVKRFRMEIVEDYRPKHPYVKLKALPLKKEDAMNWSQAEIYLNTESYLPTSVKLLDPPGTSSTVYSFTKVEVNRKDWLGNLLGKNPWKPSLRGYNVQVIDAGKNDMAQRQQQESAVKQVKADVAVIPNVVGLDHAEAENALINAGVPKSIISKHRGSPARRKLDEYKVLKQIPAAGTALSEVLKSRDAKVAILVSDKM